jgi:hypothetical protein
MRQCNERIVGDSQHVLETIPTVIRVFLFLGVWKGRSGPTEGQALNNGYDDSRGLQQETW